MVGEVGEECLAIKPQLSKGDHLCILFGTLLYHLLFRCACSLLVCSLSVLAVCQSCGTAGSHQRGRAYCHVFRAFASWLTYQSAVSVLGVFTPRTLANTTNQDPTPPLELGVKHQHSPASSVWSDIITGPLFLCWLKQKVESEDALVLPSPSCIRH